MDDPDPRWLATADELAHRLVMGAGPIRFGIASSPLEVEAALRLRRDIVVELGWRSPTEDLAHVERDAYDDRAQHVVAWDGGTIAGTLRLIRPKNGLSIPVEAEYGLVVEPRGRVMGAGRLIVAHPYRSARHAVLGGMAATAWLAMRRQGFQWAAGTATSEMLGLFTHLGFEIEILGDPQMSWGELRHPIRIGAADPTAWLTAGHEANIP